MLMVSRLVNVIAEQGNYWLANNFIWTWLFLPLIALYDVIKKETAENPDNIKTKTLGFIIVTTLFNIAWFIFIPAWAPFIRYVLNTEAYETIVYIVMIQSGFFVVYIYNCIYDGTIYGCSKTEYMLIESLFTNEIYYVMMFILWKANIFVPTLTSISLIFGIGMALDLIPTLGCYLYLLKKDNMKLSEIFSYKKES